MEKFQGIFIRNFWEIRGRILEKFSKKLKGNFREIFSGISLKNPERASEEILAEFLIFFMKLQNTFMKNYHGIPE